MDFSYDAVKNALLFAMEPFGPQETVSLIVDCNGVFVVDGLYFERWIPLQ